MAPAPKKSTKGSPKSKAESTSPPPPPVVEVVPEVEETPVEDEVETSPPVVEIAVDKYALVVEQMQTQVLIMKDLISIVKALQKEHLKTQKLTKKSKKGNGVTDAKRNPSGFAKPTQISDQLADFLGVAHGTELARTAVTRQINAYIKENDLQKDGDRRQIVPDIKLQSLLSTPVEHALSYFNLQSSIKHHFTKHSIVA